ncbi:MAG TPA: caspase family protein [Kofleriaceae bacterium]|nr:caspase family protein [Kofleriaceae bacterium]
MTRARAAIAVWLAGVAAASAAPPGAAPREARLAVLVGADQGEDDDLPLRYAELDAERMRDLFTELGDVASARAILVRGRHPGDVREAVREASGRAAELRDAGYRVTFLFYYSGHGDEDSLHLPGGRLALGELRQAIATVSAEVRLVILDACRGIARSKGVSRGDDFQISAVQRGPHGSVEVRASSDGEVAQESDELRGSVFTHFLLSGLRGDADADGDRRVTLAELYAYAYRRTLLRTQRGAVTQHATLDVALQGAGELVLATPGAAAATLHVPPGPQRYLIVATPSAGVIGEVTSAAGGFALPAGRYLVVSRDRGHTRIAEVDLSRGGSARVAAGDFHEVARDDLVARGGWLELRRSRWRVAATGELSATAPDGPALGVVAGYARLYGPWFWEVDAGGNLGTVDAQSWRGTARTLAASGLIGARWSGRRLELAAATGPELRHSWQRLEREPAVDPQMTARLDYTAIGARAALRLDVRLGRDSAISVELGGLAALRREAPVSEFAGDRLAAWWVMSSSLAYVRTF